jgi:hypothetical protein
LLYFSAMMEQECLRKSWAVLVVHSDGGQLLTTTHCSLVLWGVGVEVYATLGQVYWVHFGGFPVVAGFVKQSRWVDHVF